MNGEKRGSKRTNVIRKVREARGKEKNIKGTEEVNIGIVARDKIRKT